MLFTRLPEKKYLLGIDIGDTFCQISYLNTRRLTAGMDPILFLMSREVKSSTSRRQLFRILRAESGTSETMP